MGERAIPFKDLQSREYQGHKKKVHSVAWNCSGTKLASGSVNQTARVWQIEPHYHGKVKDVELKGHTDSVDQLCWDPKYSNLIATASGDKTVRLWDAQSGKCSQQAELSGENIKITYKPDGTHVAVVNRVNEIAWNMSGEMFSLTTGNGTVEILAYPSLWPIETLMAHTAGSYCIAIDPVGSRMSKLGEPVHQFPCRAAMNSVEWNPKYNLLAYAGNKNKYRTDEGVFRILGFETA